MLPTQKCAPLLSVSIIEAFDSRMKTGRAERLAKVELRIQDHDPVLYRRDESAGCVEGETADPTEHPSA